MNKITVALAAITVLPVAMIALTVMAAFVI